MRKQKLSPKAAAAKKARDLKTAKSPARRKKKAENQKKRRAAKAAGKYEEGDGAEINRNYDSAKTMNVLQFKQNAQKDDKAKESTTE